MKRTGDKRRAVRGFTLIETMMSMAVLLIGALGLLSMQTVSARLNRFSSKMVQASALATDLIENVKRWDYSDTRLSTSTMVTSLSDTTLAGRWDLGRNATASYTADYSDLSGDTNALTPGALSSSYQGIVSRGVA